MTQSEADSVLISSKLRRVLFVAYFFPPSNASGTHRVLRYVRHLPQFGWQPIVLTVHGNVHWIVDTDLVALVPEGTPVYRTPSLEPARSLGTVVALLLQAFGRVARQVGTHIRPGDSRNHAQPSDDAAKTLARKAFHALYDLMSIPDAQIGWLPFATWAGLRLIRRTGAELIYTTAQPWTALLVGLLLKRLTGLPWIAELRDPWTLPHNYRPAPVWLKRTVSRYLERSVLAQADLVIFWAKRARDAYLLYFPEHLQEERTGVIYNGFDPVELDPQFERRSASTDPFILSMVGTVYGFHHLEPFCDAVAHLVESRQMSPDQLVIRFVGDTCSSLPRYVNRIGLNKYISFSERVSYEQADLIMRQSTALLLPVGSVAGSSYTLPAKTFSYLLMDKPILALAPDSSEVADLIRNAKAGIVVSPTNRDAISAAILRLYDDYFGRHLAGFAPDQQFVAQFSADRLSQQLARRMDELVDHRVKRGRAN